MQQYDVYWCLVVWSVLVFGLINLYWCLQARLLVSGSDLNRYLVSCTGVWHGNLVFVIMNWCLAVRCTSVWCGVLVYSWAALTILATAAQLIPSWWFQVLRLRSGLGIPGSPLRRTG